MRQNLREWISDRFGLAPIKKMIIDRRLAKGRWYYGDGAALTLLLVVLVVTGAMMTLTYSPTPESAYQSVRYITSEQTLGWFIRALHYWSAGMMIVMLIWHVLRQILVGGYKSPREGTWLIGVGLFFAVLVMSETGYILRWDERGIYALKVMMHIITRIPLIGEHLVVFVQGGIEPGAPTLTRVFAVHVILVPLLIFGLVAWHVYLVLLHGITSRRETVEPVESAEEQKKLYRNQAESDAEGETFFPETVVKWGATATVVFAIVVGLALIAGPAPLMPEANQVEQAMPSEEWWFWWFSSSIALLPSWVAPWFVIVFPLVVLVAMVLLPLLDRTSKRGIRGRPAAVAFVVLVVISLFGLSGLHMQSPWTGWPEPDPPEVPPGIVLTEDAELGRRLFAKKGCNSCHSVAGEGPRVALDLATLDEQGALSRDELRSFILEPPEGVAMPAYEGRVTEEELDRLVDYVLVAQTFSREEE